MTDRASSAFARSRSATIISRWKCMQSLLTVASPPRSHEHASSTEEDNCKDSQLSVKNLPRWTEQYSRAATLITAIQKSKLTEYIRQGTSFCIYVLGAGFKEGITHRGVRTEFKILLNWFLFERFNNNKLNRLKAGNHKKVNINTISQNECCKNDKSCSDSSGADDYTLPLKYTITLVLVGTEAIYQPHTENLVSTLYYDGNNRKLLSTRKTHSTQRTANSHMCTQNHSNIITNSDHNNEGTVNIVHNLSNTTTGNVESSSDKGIVLDIQTLFSNGLYHEIPAEDKVRQCIWIKY